MSCQCFKAYAISFRCLLHIPLLPATPTALVGLWKMLQHPHVYPRKVCNTLKLFCGCCFGHQKQKQQQHFPTTVRFYCVFHASHVVYYKLILLLFSPVPSFWPVGPALFAAGFSGCWRFENWLQTHDYPTTPQHLLCIFLHLSAQSHPSIV